MALAAPLRRHVQPVRRVTRRAAGAETAPQHLGQAQAALQQAPLQESPELGL
jgi:hypothetical protein